MGKFESIPEVCLCIPQMFEFHWRSMHFVLSPKLKCYCNNQLKRLKTIRENSFIMPLKIKLPFHAKPQYCCIEYALSSKNQQQSIQNIILSQSLKWKMRFCCSHSMKKFLSKLTNSMLGFNEIALIWNNLVQLTRNWQNRAIYSQHSKYRCIQLQPMSKSLRKCMN